MIHASNRNVLFCISEIGKNKPYCMSKAQNQFSCISKAKDWFSCIYKTHELRLNIHICRKLKIWKALLHVETLWSIFMHVDSLGSIIKHVQVLKDRNKCLIYNQRYFFQKLLKFVRSELIYLFVKSSGSNSMNCQFSKDQNQISYMSNAQYRFSNISKIRVLRIDFNLFPKFVYYKYSCMSKSHALLFCIPNSGSIFMHSIQF